jgi:hypothetical protein
MIRRSARRAPPPPPPARKAATPKVTTAENEQQYEKSYSKPTPSASSEQQALNELAKKQASEKARTRTGQAGPPMPIYGNPFPPQTPAQKQQYEKKLAIKKAANPNPAPSPGQMPPKSPATNFAMKKGGVAKYAKGGKVDGCARKGKTKGRMV